VGEQLTVAQLATRENVTPQQVNGWVTKEGLPTVEGAAKRTIDLDVFTEWSNARSATKQHRKAERQETKVAKASGQPVKRNSAVLALTQEERLLLAWSRGPGRGWALAAPTAESQPFVDDYIVLVNHMGLEHGTTEHRLLREAKEGKLFFMDPAEAAAFLAGQLAAVIDSDASEPLADAVNHLSLAATALAEWRKLRVSMTPEERAELLADAAARKVVDDQADLVGKETE
jgi:hypothetical protein